MKTVLVGDTHGRSFWKLILEIERPDRIVFVGDYFDTKDDISAAEQIHNFKEIIRYKEIYPGIEFILLFGNHDYHYLPGINYGQYSDFQPLYAHDIQEVLKANMKHLRLAYLLNGKFLITHAGVTNTFIRDTKALLGTTDEDQILDLEQFLNDILKFKPEQLVFNGIDPYGDDETQSPIWVRPQSLFRDRYTMNNTNYHQIVGHTTVQKINHPGGSGNVLYFIDTLGTSKEYLVIDEKNNVIIKSLSKSHNK